MSRAVRTSSEFSSTPRVPPTTSEKGTRRMESESCATMPLSVLSAR